MSRTIEELEKLPKEFITPKEAAACMGISRKSFYKLAQSGGLPFRMMKIKTHWIIPKQSFIEFLKRV